MYTDHKVASNPHQSTSTQPAHPSCTASSVRTKIASCIPLLRVSAHVRTHNGLEADALVEATLQTALAGIDDYSTRPSVKAWLLGIQRAVFNAGQVRGGEPADLASKDGSDGPGISGGNLHADLLRLPDHLREPLVLHDGALCTMAQIAEILACDAATATRRIEEARCRLQELCETRSEHGHTKPKSPGRDESREADFQVFKPASSRWKVQAVSSKARHFLQKHLALEGEAARRGAYFTDRSGANEFIVLARMRGYLTDLIGPRGPVRM